MRSYLIISTLLIFLLTVFFMGAVLLRQRRRPESTTFCLFGLSVGWWSFSYLMWQFATNEQGAWFWCQMLVLGSTFIPVTYLDFVTTLTGYRKRWILLTGYLIAVLVAILNLGPLVIARVEPRMGFPFWPIAGPAFTLYLGNFFLFVLYSFYLLLKKYRNSSPKIRNQLQYLIIGTALGYAGCSTNFFLWAGIPIGPVGQGLGVLYILGIGYSVIKYRLLEFNQIFLRLIITFFAAITLSLLFSFASFEYITGLDGSVENPEFIRYLTLLSLLFIAIFLFLPKINQALNSLLAFTLRQNKDLYQSRLKDMANELSKIEDEETIFSEWAHRLHELAPVRRLAIYYRNEFESSFHLKKAMGDHPLFPLQITLKEIEPLQNLLLRTNRSLWFGELNHQEKSSHSTPHAQDSSGDSFFIDEDLVVPVISGKIMVGFLVLGPRMDGKIHIDTDIALLENLCNQIGLTIRSRQIERRANQVDKLVSLGTLAAGLAHELKNPLVSIKTFSSILSQSGETRYPSGNGEFLEIVQRDISRIAGIIESVAAFAENTDITFSRINIHEVIDKTLEIEAHRFKQYGVTFNFQPGNTRPIQGNFNQLVQVFINLIENAITAMETSEKRVLTVFCETLSKNSEHPWLQIRISDTGPGIPENLIPRVFDPFITTKATGPRTGKSGAGLGLAIVKRIIEAHRGVIRIENQPGGGILMKILIPCSHS